MYLGSEHVSNHLINSMASPLRPLQYKRLHHFSLDKWVKGLPTLANVTHFCEQCTLGKQIWKKIPKTSSSHTTHPLELVHSDVCGPFHTTSMGGSKYFITFIDDFSRRVWVYFMKYKHQSLEKF
jgi:hypothetical protein